MSSLPAIYEAFPEPAKRDNRRNSARTRLFTLVNTHDRPDPMWAWDIGLGGMQCRTRKPRFPGTYLDLNFTLPGTNDSLEVGSQVLSLDQLAEDDLSVGLRFCMLSARNQRLIYRFLDQRRALWSDQHPPASPVPSDVASSDSGPVDLALVEAAQTRVARIVAAQKRPFESLLLEAYASMRAKELRRFAFVRSVRANDLQPLSQLTRPRLAAVG